LLDETPIVEQLDVPGIKQWHAIAVEIAFWPVGRRIVNAAPFNLNLIDQLLWRLRPGSDARIILPIPDLPSALGKTKGFTDKSQPQDCPSWRGSFMLSRNAPPGDW